MQPRTKWYVNVLGFSAMGIFFLILGVYGLTSVGSARLFLLGAVCAFVGLRVLWEAVKYVRPLRTSTQNVICVCPFCGAIVPNDATVCAKCGREITK